MSEPTKTERMTRELEKYQTVEDMKKRGKEYAKEIDCATSLVYKVIKKIMAKRPADQKALPESREPVVKIEKAEEVEILEPEEKEIGEPEIIEPEELEELEEEEKEEITEEKAERLGDIFERSFERLLNIPIGSLGLQKRVGLTSQDMEDSAFLVTLLVAKNTGTEMITGEYGVEIVSSFHFGSIGIKVLAEWLKKRAEEKKKEEEKKAEREKRAQPQEPEKPAEAEVPTPQELARRKAVKPAAIEKL